jgi:hypothetical protein
MLLLDWISRSPTGPIDGGPYTVKKLLVAIDNVNRIGLFVKLKLTNCARTGERAGPFRFDECGSY